MSGASKSAASDFLRALVRKRTRIATAASVRPADVARGAAAFTSAHAVAAIGGRRLHFEAYPSQARLRITMLAPETCAETALGSVIRLDTDDPGLRVCAPMEVEWSARHMKEIVAEGVRIWGSLTRGCEG